MFKKILNEAWITFKIKATGPILIKAGETDEETEQRQQIEHTPKMVFVIDANKEIFIPGSSIKGVWRSWCEKIARTISTEVPPLSCDPLCDNEKSENFSCSKRLEELKKKIQLMNMHFPVRFVKYSEILHLEAGLNFLMLFYLIKAVGRD